jgi:hypothetical protein
MYSSKLNEFLCQDNEKIDRLIEAFPVNLPVSAISDFLSLDVASVRAAIENEKFGVSWRKTGKANHGYFIPTAQFIRWYLNMG